jgi:alkanesulfonate monooxygenase
LSCDGDTAHLGQKSADDPPSYETFTRIARNAERSGFSTILVPTHQSSAHFLREAPAWDSLVTAAVIAPATKSIKLLLAVRAGIIEPAALARILASLDELSGGRILYNVVTGGKFQTAFSGEIEHDDRYERTEEYLQILDGLWTQDGYSFKGKYYQVEDVVVYPKPTQKPRIPFFLAGSSEIARQIAVRRAEYSVFWGKSPDQVASRVRDMEERLEGTGRKLKYVTRFQIVARETEDEAFEAAQELLSRADTDVLTQRGIDPAEAAGDEALAPKDRTREEMVSPGFWGGMGRIRSGSTVAIVGSYNQCAQKIIEFERAGIDLLILSGFPLHSECERIGRHVIPLVRGMEIELGLAKNNH